MSQAAGPFYDKTPFFVLVDLLEKLTEKKNATRQKLMETFFKESHYGWGHFFAVYRLFMPKHDSERTTYGLKEKTIAKAYVAILAIPATSEDGTRLLKFQFNTSTQHSGGDFSTAVFAALERRSRAEARSLTIAQVNDYLDRIARAANMEAKKVVLAELLKCTTALMQKWIIRIILKDLKLGVSEKFFLRFLHPDADTMFTQCSRLRRVCEELTDPLKRQTDFMVSINVPFKPQLAQSRDLAKLDLESHHYVVETKYDGHRVQVHRDGERFSYFSRNTQNHERDYGSVLAPLLRECVKSDRYILDGELMTWYDTGGPDGTGCFGKFKEVRSAGIAGRNAALAAAARGGGGGKGGGAEADNGGKGTGGGKKRAAPDGGDGGEDDDDDSFVERPPDGGRLILIVFDICMAMGNSLLHKPLRERDEILRNIVQPKPKHLEIVTRKHVTCVQDINDALDVALANRDEGIMLKDWNDAYHPNERKWIKIKPDYLNGVGDNVDLVILGAWLGEGVGGRSGTPSHFLLGVPAPPRSGATGPTKWWTVGKVGTGYSLPELAKMQYRLQRHWKLWDPRQQVIELTPQAETPSYYLDPSAPGAGMVLEIRFASLEPSEKYRIGYTLRHPRVECIRDDKGIEDCNTVEDVLAMAARGAAVRSHGDALRGGGGGDARKKRAADKKRKTSPVPGRLTTQQLASAQAAAGAGDVERLSNIWDGWRIYGSRKLAVETTIVQHGGSIVKFPGATTDCIIGERDNIRVVRWSKEGKWDIAKPEWIDECIKAKALVEFEPRWMIHTTPETRALMLQEMDAFGVHYTRDTTAEELQTIFAHMDECGVDLNAVDSSDAMRALEEALEPERPFFSMCKHFVFYLDVFEVVGDDTHPVAFSPLEVTSKLIRHFQGTISSRLDSKVTHVIMHPNYQTRYKQITAHMAKLAPRQRYVLSYEWVLKSVEKHEALAVSEFAMEAIHRLRKRLRNDQVKTTKQRQRSLIASLSVGGSLSLGSSSVGSIGAGRRE